MADRALREASRRRLIHTGTLSAGVLLVAALLAIVNYFGWKYHKRFDWTSSQLYSLSEKSKNVLSGLDGLGRDIEAVVFLSPQDELYEPVHEILARYDAASPRLSVRYVDPQKNPVEAQQLVQKYQVSNAGVVFASGDDRRVVESGELAEMDFSGMQLGQQPQMTGFKGEQLFTSAILQLSEGRKPKILFTTGHGEASLDDQSARGLSGAQEILGSDNFDLEEWASLGKSAVPEGTDLVVVAGPKGSFVQPELDTFSAYLAKGGRMLVLADPVLGSVLGQAAGSGLVPTGLDRWLAGYGVRLGEDIVVDPSNPLPFFGAETIFVNSYGDHPITRSLRQANLPVLMSVVRSAGKGASEGTGPEPVQLLQTSAEGWGETDLARLEKVERDSADLGGPVPLGVVVAPPAPPAPPDTGAGGEQPAAATKPDGMRLVVFGDSDFATNQLLQANQANAVLLANTLNWLVERETLLGIPPKKTETVRLSLTSGEMRSVYLLSLLALPGLGVALGAAVYFRRRR